MYGTEQDGRTENIAHFQKIHARFVDSKSYLLAGTLTVKLPLSCLYFLCCAFTSMCCDSSWGWLWQLCYVAPWESISCTVAHCRDISVFTMKQMFWFDFFFNILYLILLCAEGFLISKQSKISKSLNVFHSCHLFLWFTAFALSPSDHNKRTNLAFELNCSPLSMLVIGSYETWRLSFGVYIYPIHKTQVPVCDMLTFVPYWSISSA